MILPVPLLAVAIPVVHSSGVWIASTAASGYITGTLSSTWLGTFILGNSTLLSSFGFISAAGVFGASGGIAALSTSAALGVGSALTAVGLGGLASALGIAPVATFLGLTPVGWAITGAFGTIAAIIVYFFILKAMRRINIERVKGGLESITVRQILKEVRSFEAQSLNDILERLDAEMDNVTISNDRANVTINDRIYSLRRLKYVVNKDGSEEIVFTPFITRMKRVLLVKPAIV
jgi:hypothetical protein